MLLSLEESLCNQIEKQVEDNLAIEIEAAV